jgi:glycosyltransferase involved in cell wall biosynthesis
VLPTRGEGWGLPLAEAMSMGLPVITTNWSGPTAFVDESVGYLLEYDLVLVRSG